MFLTLFAIVAFFVPTFGGLFLEEANFEPANPLSTPEPIAPSWYFTPYYAILRAVPNQRLGALLLLIAVLAFFFLPWLDRSPVKSVRYRGALFRGFPGAVHGLVPDADVPRAEAGHGRLRDGRARGGDRLLRLLPADALVLARRSHQTRS